MIALFNSTNKKILARECMVCSDIFSKAKGLMFTKKATPLIFIFNKEKIVPLHMCFVFFAIDVIFLNKDKRVVEIKENFLPWTFYSPKNKAMYVIETAKGTIKKTRTNVGDLVEF